MSSPSFPFPAPPVAQAPVTTPAARCRIAALPAVSSCPGTSCRPLAGFQCRRCPPTGHSRKGVTIPVAHPVASTSPPPASNRDATTETAPPPAGGYRLPRYEIPGSEGSREPGGNWGALRGETGGFPLPLPGGNPPQDNPYGDLSDTLRRRGNAPAPDGGGSLWSVVRNGLGGLLGFGGSGLFGWLVRLAVLKLGWPLLRRMIFGR